MSDHIPVRNLALADTSKLVSITADGHNQIVTTDADTVGDVLKRADVSLEKGDLVEPDVATQLPHGFFNINVYRGQTYRIVDGVTSTLVRSAQQAPALIAADAGIKIYPEDKTNVDQVNDFVGDGVIGQNIIITRAKVFNVVADGKTLTLRSQALTIGEALKDKKVPLGAEDKVSPAPTEDLTNGADVRITRVSEAVVTQNEVLAHQTQIVADATLLKGVHQVKTAGVDGKRTVTYRVHYHDGTEVGRETLKIEGEVDPVTEVDVVGTKVIYANDTIALAAQMAGDRGWVDGQWDALYQLWMRESGFNPNSVNSYSGACGIPQANPCSKMADKSVSGQISWGLDYIASRYGTPAAAWAYWQSHHSY